MDRQDDDLEELLSDLSTTLSELQDTLDGSDRSRSRRVPSPGRFLRFTEEYTIPALISLLETHIRALELLQGLLRVINGREERAGASEGIRDRRVRETGRRTIDALDGVLSDLQGALEGQPSDDDARDLLNDARSLSEEIEGHLSRPNEDGETKNRDERSTDDRRAGNGAVRIDVEGLDSEDEDEGEDGDEEISVDEELDTIKQELQDDDEDGDE